MVGDSEGHDKAVSSSQAALLASVPGAALPALAGTGLAATAAATMLPPLIVYVRDVFARARDTQESRAEEALKIACDIVGGLDMVDRWTAADDIRMALLVEVLQAASRTPLKIKIQALAEVLAEGLQVDGAAHEARLIASALNDIEAPHVETLHFLNETPLPPDELRKPNHSEPRGWEVAQIGRALPPLAGVLDNVVAVLSGHGLIGDQGGVTYPGGVGPAVWKVTDLGRKCLRLLQFGTTDRDTDVS